MRRPGPDPACGLELPMVCAPPSPPIDRVPVVTKVLLFALWLILPAVGCNRQDNALPNMSPAPTAGEDDGAAKAGSPEDPAQESVHVTPDQWLANPAFKKDNPYDLPLEYEIKLPKLPPKGVMEPCPELPPEQG